MLLSPAFRKQRQVELFNFEGILVYTANTRAARAYSETLTQKKKILSSVFITFYLFCMWFVTHAPHTQVNENVKKRKLWPQDSASSYQVHKTVRAEQECQRAAHCCEGNWCNLAGSQCTDLRPEVDESGPLGCLSPSLKHLGWKSGKKNSSAWQWKEWTHSGKFMPCNATQKRNKPWWAKRETTFNF